jgi:hypothetical protein
MRLVILSAAAALLITAGSAAAQAPAPASGGAPAGPMPSAADILKQWDTDKDGTISKAEWVAAGRPAERFDAVDTNKDGKISADELDKAMAAMRAHQGGGQ